MEATSRAPSWDTRLLKLRAHSHEIDSFTLIQESMTTWSNRNLFPRDHSQSRRTPSLAQDLYHLHPPSKEVCCQVWKKNSQRAILRRMKAHARAFRLNLICMHLRRRIWGTNFSNPTDLRTWASATWSVAIRHVQSAKTDDEDAEYLVPDTWSCPRQGQDIQFPYW